LGTQQIREYLDYLAEVRLVSAFPQNQALNAIVFLFNQVLKVDPGEFGDFTKVDSLPRNFHRAYIIGYIILQISRHLPSQLSG